LAVVPSIRATPPRALPVASSMLVVSNRIPALFTISPKMQHPYCIVPATVHNAGMTLGMLTLQRPTRFSADGALFFASCGDRLAVRTRGVHPRNVSSNLAPRTIVVSGTATAETVTAPDHQPRDLAPKKMTASRNIAPNRSIFQNAGHFPQMSDLARHEQPLPRQTD
jgi:hypothetical protein